jgi:glycosyltransferase involved in cell wall biosynthesis
MKIAIVHDDLIQFGGAEKLIMHLLTIWPDSTLFTSYVSPEWEQVLHEKKIIYKTSFMQKLPYKNKLNKYYAGLFMYPIAFESFDFTGYDVVFSVSARFAHSAVTKPSTKHISYINSPGRMFWEFWDYFENFNFSQKRMLNKIYLNYLKVITTYYRMWDFYASKRPDYLIANSQTPQRRINKYYGRDSSIIYPFVDLAQFENRKKTKENYYLIISRIVAWKRIDIAVDAFIKNGKNLQIIGDGPELNNLKNKAAGHKNIEFLGKVSEEEKIDLLCRCSALINTQLEDFGIVPLEAMAAGKPVLAYGKGGVLETVLPGKTGEFFHEQSESALNEALKNFEPTKYLLADCQIQARKFDKEVFSLKIKNFVDSVYLES